VALRAREFFRELDFLLPLEIEANIGVVGTLIKHGMCIRNFPPHLFPHSSFPTLLSLASSVRTSLSLTHSATSKICVKITNASVAAFCDDAGA